ncbi:hypothetical protein GCM10025868_10320 [Angustibacter aerolatus]|uniref:Aminopeptidase N-like N-terminal domain-containing protein n=1 Tax=Angustibacter aerolatus TaxID=1162965 RepID=A0ABQ6JC83_9ACTN|nr:hypothetical protein GCM10025868_10320 [Angustibacter aerolatus]
MNTGEGLHRFVDPVDDEVYLYSQFEVADSRRVFAVFEQPDLKGRFTFTVTAPDHWVVVSNSPPPSRCPRARAAPPGRSRRRPSSPRTSRPSWPARTSTSTASLTSSDGRTIPLGVYCRRSLGEHLDTDEIAQITTQGFEYFERVFDLPYPFEKYDQPVRAGVQRRGHGERRGGDVPREPTCSGRRSPRR